MISTRTHALIDLVAAPLLGGLALLPALRPRVRAALGTVGALQAAAAAATDYEGGLTPRLPMRTHLALDAVGAAGLCAAGLALRGVPAAQRGLLLGAGLAQLAALARTSTRPGDGPGRGTLAERLQGVPPHSHVHDASYPPLDTPKPVAEDVWIVDSTMPPALSLRMTVLRLANGDLLLHSPTAYTPALHRALESLGRIRHLVAPNVAHWMFMKGWQDAVPGTVAWAAPNLRRRGAVQRSGLRLDHDLGDAAPPEWAGEVRQAVIRGGVGFTEVAMFHAASRTLLLTDLVLNLEPAKLPAPMRLLFRLLGATAPDGRAPAYLRGIVRLGRAGARDAARRVLGWGPERVIFSHGRWFERDGAAELLRSWRWLLE